MGTVIDRIELADGGWRTRHSALRLAVNTANACLREAGREPHDVDLLVNAGLYRERNLGEPALAAMIQEDIHANPEDPHAGSHGTFSFDVMNGSCGVLTALQVVDGFLRSRTIDCALVVASDANPGHGMSEDFPFAPTGAALLCTRTEDERGLGRTYWENLPDHSDAFCATVGMVDHRNILRFAVSPDADEHFADAAARAVSRCLREADLRLEDVGAIVAAPARHGFRAALAAKLGVPQERITVGDDDQMHTTALASALNRVTKAASDGEVVLLVAAGAGVTAGAALYRF